MNRHKLQYSVLKGRRKKDLAWAGITRYWQRHFRPGLRVLLFNVGVPIKGRYHVRNRMRYHSTFHNIARMSTVFQWFWRKAWRYVFTTMLRKCCDLHFLRYNVITSYDPSATVNATTIRTKQQRVTRACWKAAVVSIWAGLTRRLSIIPVSLHVPVPLLKLNQNACERNFDWSCTYCIIYIEFVQTEPLSTRASLWLEFHSCALWWARNLTGTNTT